MIIEYLKSGSNSCLAIGGTRITPEKVWGVMYTVMEFNVFDDILENAFIDGVCEFEVYDYELYINGTPIIHRHTKEDLDNHIKNLEKRRKRFLKDNNHKHNWNLCRRERWFVTENNFMDASGHRQE